MEAAAPAFLIAIEQSSLGAAIRQSIWLYPAANIGHILGLAALAGAVAVLDLRLIGAFGATRPLDVLLPARRASVAALLVMLLTGSILFVAEASHVALNPVFQLKAVLIVLALANAAVLGGIAIREAEQLPARAPFSGRVRLAAALSIVLWLSVAAAGRLIAYV